MIDTQLMKGILEGCVLSVIAEHETYGYEILQRLTESGFTELGEGTMGKGRGCDPAGTGEGMSGPAGEERLY